MSNVISINQPKKGETTFLCCPCTDEPAPFVPVAIVSENPVIIALLCPECEKEIPVVNGILG